MPAQLKEKVSAEEHRSEHDPIDHLVCQEKCILIPPVTWSGSFVCQLHMPSNSVDENRFLATNLVDCYSIFL